MLMSSYSQQNVRVTVFSATQRQRRIFCIGQKRQEIQGEEVPRRRGKERLLQDQVISLSRARALCLELSTIEGKQEGAYSCSG